MKPIPQNIECGCCKQKYFCSNFEIVHKNLACTYVLRINCKIDYHTNAYVVKDACPHCNYVGTWFYDETPLYLILNR